MSGCSKRGRASGELRAACPSPAVKRAHRAAAGASDQANSCLEKGVGDERAQEERERTSSVQKEATPSLPAPAAPGAADDAAPSLDKASQAHRSPDSVLQPPSLDPEPLDLPHAAAATASEAPAPAATRVEVADAAARSTPPSSAGRGLPTEAELALLECPVCYSHMQPPFVSCKNKHPVCSECRPNFENEECPICRVNIEADELVADEALAALASRLALPCKNGCGATVPYEALREHEQHSCVLAPRLCPFRNVVQLGPNGWTTSGRCECRGLDTSDAEAMSAHLQEAHGCTTQPLDKADKLDKESEHERTCTWTLSLPTPDVFELPTSAEQWGLPAVHRWPATVLTRADGKAFLVQCIAARHSGVSLLVLGLSAGTEGMHVEAHVQGQQGSAPPYTWISRVLAADAMRPGLPPAEEARLLRRAVAFPEAALEFCCTDDADGGKKLTVILSIRADDEEDSDEEIDDDAFEFIYMLDGDDAPDDADADAAEAGEGDVDEESTLEGGDDGEAESEL